MTDLSPAAQIVLDAAIGAAESPDAEAIAAAALRAATEVVAPIGYEEVWTDGKWLQYEKQDPVRAKILAIADELGRTR